MTAAERLARNNSLFREANERIRAKAESYGTGMDRLPFLCECPREDCHELVRISLPDYASIRDEMSHFLVAPDHETAEGQYAMVVRRTDSYVVVEKTGEARDALDRPRS